MTNKQQKLLQQLQKAKFRKEFGFFVVEGTKMVRELCLEIPAQIEWLAATDNWIFENKDCLENANFPIIETAENVLKANSSLQTSPLAIVVVKQNNWSENNLQSIQNESLTNIYLILETIQDPGNMGTIIRTADWFGVQNIFITDDCVDIYNPKVVQSSMSSIWRIPVKTIENKADFFEKNRETPVFGAVLGGDNLYEITLKNQNLLKNVFLVMGNESKGISEEMMAFLNHKIEIPRFGKAESLNVAMATGILLSHFREKFD